MLAEMNCLGFQNNSKRSDSALMIAVISKCMSLWIRGLQADVLQPVDETFGEHQSIGASSASLYRSEYSGANN